MIESVTFELFQNEHIFFAQCVGIETKTIGFRQPFEIVVVTRVVYCYRLGDEEKF